MSGTIEGKTQAVMPMACSADLHQGSKLTLADSQNASEFDNPRVRKMSTSKRLRVTRP